MIDTNGGDRSTPDGYDSRLRPGHRPRHRRPPAPPRRAPQRAPTSPSSIPPERAAFLSRKADLFTRLAEQAEHTRIDAYSQQIRQMADDRTRRRRARPAPTPAAASGANSEENSPPSAHHEWGQITGEPRGQFWLTQPEWPSPDRQGRSGL